MPDPKKVQQPRMQLRKGPVCLAPCIELFVNHKLTFWGKKSLRLQILNPKRPSTSLPLLCLSTPPTHIKAESWKEAKFLDMVGKMIMNCKAKEWHSTSCYILVLSAVHSSSRDVYLQVESGWAFNHLSCRIHCNSPVTDYAVRLCLVGMTMFLWKKAHCNELLNGSNLYIR